MNYHIQFPPSSDKVATTIIGTGGFGRSYLAQCRKVPLLEARVAVDVTAEQAARTMIEVGYPEARIRKCDTAEEAAAAWAAGDFIAAGDFAHVAALPVHVVIEATGHPEAGARHCRLAVEAGHHVALVSKEVDSVVGPGLAALAREKGCVVSPVDGDQPSLLIELITWAELLGFEIIAAGKSSEYDFIFDAAAGTLTSDGRMVSAPDFAQWADLDDRPAAEVVAGRANAASALPQRAVPDLCELTVVANATGFAPDAAPLHAPIARITEVPTLFSTRDEGGILDGRRVLDVFHCLREPGEVSFAGGVFVVIRCDDAETWKMLEGKGHVVARDRNTAMIYNPRHLLGLEAATTILSLGLLARGTGGHAPAHHIDLVAFADRDLAAGEALVMGGHHHSIPGVSARMVAAGPLSDESPAPFYLASNQTIRRPVAAGSYIRMGDLEHRSNTELLTLRQRQDAIFAKAKGMQG
ncbi:NAD(P)H-dependent oxidoreductase [Paracoccus denitrificans]|jgi:predicted homoserine dehydrogenase-like protein|uniref:SAF domain n=1 Tax=Paracoccus denitrificans (strain Pd 1222) TaxID=318586 RepID=A1B7G7_PARDP|nr:flagellar protein FlgA [Paracoccus denitrificans]ABL71461.1 SAF domain [Paracoccus denitrificans PD1222]MBB4629659.1 putative homoserine dehydrogenase-like protein [Paracoccus denitrificans]MCU7430678.1 flagellar biosynthesis protein FlgA [Paracoccus denitrificans]QAR28072.1 flagellar biosynthesis protein FlgA [Paracoccus denitrificans]UPV97797.1 flagellar biosynthesis protein FlgA [Paracoccus denitrificans]